MKRMTKGTIESRVSSFLFKYQVTPRSTTGVPPAELMFNRKLWAHLDLLQPSIGQTARQNQSKQKMYHDTHSRTRDFKEGDAVYACNFDGTGKWLPGTILAKQGPLSLLMMTEWSDVISTMSEVVCLWILLWKQRPVFSQVLPFSMNNDPEQ